MNEIRLPVRVVAPAKPERALWTVRDSKGLTVCEGCWGWEAEEITAALNEVAALRAQVERVRALVNRWALVQQAHPTLHVSLDGEKAHDARGRYAAGAVRDCARELRDALEGGGHPGDARGAHRAPDEGIG